MGLTKGAPYKGRGEGALHGLRLAERPPHPARKSAPTSPRKPGEVKQRGNRLT